MRRDNYGPWECWVRSWAYVAAMGLGRGPKSSLKFRVLTESLTSGARFLYSLKSIVHGKEFWKDDAVRFLEFILNLIVEMLITDDNEDVTPVYCSWKRLSILRSITTPGNEI
ncbi:hypothetical protein Tco_0390690 [Tanacetum coccineum]